MTAETTEPEGELADSPLTRRRRRKILAIYIEVPVRDLAAIINVADTLAEETTIRPHADSGTGFEVWGYAK